VADSNVFAASDILADSNVFDASFAVGVSFAAAAYSFAGTYRALAASHAYHAEVAA